eukprot:4914041-Amphidinium_carterae.5
MTLVLATATFCTTVVPCQYGLVVEPLAIAGLGYLPAAILFKHPSGAHSEKLDNIMLWNATDVAQLMTSFAFMQKMGGGKPGNWGSRRRSPSTPQDKPRKDFAGTSWNCTVCGFYNFGYRKACFQCKQQARQRQCEAKQDRRAGFKTRGAGNKARWTGWKGRCTAHKDKPEHSIQSRRALDGPMTEQLLRKQIKAAKDGPVMMEILELALKKLTADKQQALPLKDQRAKYIADSMPKPSNLRRKSTSQRGLSRRP